MKVGKTKMSNILGKFIKKSVRTVGYDINSTNDPYPIFHTNNSLRITARRLEHLASLGISVAGNSVLEVGAGIGDHSNYYLDRGCKVTITDGRPANLKYLKLRFPDQDIQFLDLEHPLATENFRFEIIHCYGTLYHLNNPEKALEFLSGCCQKMMFLETCVSFGDQMEINLVKEDEVDLSQSISGFGCRPTRPWLYEKLKALFEYVYIPVTQPNHEEFPIDWMSPERYLGRNCRAVFVASNNKIESPNLTSDLIQKQRYHP
jgi:hypothetical protein